MARRAAELGEMVCRRLAAGQGLVALVASHCHVAARERKSRLLVLRQRETGGFESRPIVALLAAIVPGIACELTLVLVFVAVDTICKFDFELCGHTRWRMALRALDAGVRRDQRKSGFRMVRNRES